MPALRREPQPLRTDRTEYAEQWRALVRANAPANLGAYLRRVAQASVAAGAIASAGCAASHFPSPTELSSPTCVDGSWRPLSRLEAPVPYDYVAAIEHAGMLPVPRTIDERGAMCAGASDAEACAAEGDAAVQATYGRFLITTEGDTVRTHSTSEAVVGVLGAIETPDEALLRAWQAGYDVQCTDTSRSGARAVEGGYEVVATQVSGGCGSPVITTRYLLFVSTEGELSVIAEEQIERRNDAGCAGRRPEGLREARALESASLVGGYFASMGRLESAAVTAFEVLASELEALGAPGELVERARAAARDEVRHAEVMGALARHFDAEPIAAEVDAHPLRPLFALALENTVEGCVRETFGAVLGHHQALAAVPDVARAMAVVAEDETRHAELSWAIAAWAEPLLDESERAELARARARAVAELRDELRAEPDEALRRIAGLPDAHTALLMLEDLSQRIWA